jgi:predicted amidohydrolase
VAFVSRTLRLAALQLRAHDRSTYESLRSSLFDRIARAAAQRDLLVLPEGTFPAYVLGGDAVDERLLADARDRLAYIAREHACVIVAGTAAYRGSALYNSAIVIDRDGTLAGSAEKIFLWHFDNQWFARGAQIEPVTTSIGRLGVLVCADGRMPGISRALVDRGAELLVMPTAWVTSGRDPQHLENLQADLLGRVRAFENGVPFIAANKAGIEMRMVAYCGKSQIVDASGEMRALGSQFDEEIVAAQIALAAPAPYRVTQHARAARTATAERALRIAIAIDPLPSDLNDRLRILEADLALAGHGADDFETLDRALPTARIDAADAFDPDTLVAYRLAGYRAAILDAERPHPWLERIARTRAAELRLFVIVFDRQAHRAYAIDPDGAIVAGTFGDFAIASFVLDPRRTEQTTLVPGTDVAEGIERVRGLTERTAEVS